MPRPRPIVRLLALLVGGALVAAAPVPPAWAAVPKIDPEKTEGLRAAARSKAETSGDASAQADVLFRSGQELGDPVLMLDAADRLALQADQDRSTELAETALEHVAVALDVAYFMGSENYARTRWHPVAPSVASVVLERAEKLRGELQALIDEIEAERAAAAAAAAAAANKPPKPEKKERKPGTGLIAGGAVTLSIGLGGVGLMAAGLVIGADRQKQAEGLDLPAQMDELERLDEEGAQANIFAYVGGAVAAVGLGVGLGLIIAGAKKRRAARSGEVEEPETASIMLVPQPTGATLMGRF